MVLEDLRIVKGVFVVAWEVWVWTNSWCGDTSTRMVVEHWLEVLEGRDGVSPVFFPRPSSSPCKQDLLSISSSKSK